MGKTTPFNHYGKNGSSNNKGPYMAVIVNSNSVTVTTSKSLLYTDKKPRKKKAKRDSTAGEKAKEVDPVLETTPVRVATYSSYL